jgi:hypothetical protein
LKANPGELQSVAVHQEVPKEEAEVEMIVSSEGASWGQASSRKAPPTDEETDPGRWWVPAEVGRCPRTVDRPCQFLHRERDTVVRDQMMTIMYAEPLKDERSRRDIGSNLNATMA